MIGLAWLMSTDRKAITWRPVLWGVGLQLAFGAIVLAPWLQDFFFVGVDAGVKRLLSFAEAGADFVFQTTEPHQIEVGFGGGQPETFIGRISPPVKTFAFWILPTIVFFSSLMSILYHLGIMQVLVKAIAWVMQRTMGTSGSESLAAASNIFVGQTEAPLVVKPYVHTMTRSELHALMTGGFATVAGGVMAAYVGFLKDIPGIAGHLVTASILSAPAALAISKVMVPETQVSDTAGKVTLSVPSEAENVMEAAARGATEGMKLAINVAAMLIAFVGLVAMIDWVLTLAPITFCASEINLGYSDTCEPLSLARILGWVFSPIAFAMGVPWDEAAVVGRLLGEKLVLTEFIAYVSLGGLVNAEVPVLSERSAIIASYALCGFANFASVGIQLGGIGGIAPERMGDLSALALRAMIAGSLAAFMTATVAGVLLG
ncbi:MAG: NupC/NupG family nucleoside CNT transporter [Alphaproteobacteria bacterium]|nr:NupC/NupG family nucleoside CNT transporter [Alphaproteobacteria bacterium]